jgi:hypothetical protein
MILDIEANGLLLDVTKIWVVKVKPLDSSMFYTFTNAQDLFLFFEHRVPECLIGHNVYGYDLPVLEKVWGVDYSHNKIFGKKVPIWDTLLMSQYVEPDMLGHSLDDWGKRLGREKIDYRAALIAAGALDKDAERGAEFGFYHPLMETYCERDCEVCEMVFNKLKGKV